MSDTPMTAAQVLATHQRQLDEDGVIVGVPRQAIDEVLAALAAARSECLEQSRLLGISGSKEAALLAEVAAASVRFQDMTADRDSWREQASDRLKDWSDQRDKTAQAEAEVVALKAERDGMLHRYQKTSAYLREANALISDLENAIARKP